MPSVSKAAAAALSGSPPQTEKPTHYRYLKEFRTEQCPLFSQHKCAQHRPFTCFHWHFLNQRRRRPLRRRDGTFNYSPDVYCSKYNEATGVCPDGDECPYLHRTTGDTERKYHLRYYKTGTCIHETDARGHCVKNGLHCAFAHGPLDLRPPVCDVRELQAQEALQNGQLGGGEGVPDLQPGVLASQAMIEKILSEDPRWQDANFVLGSYKTEQCPKPPRLCRQGYACPHYHNSRDRRRNPRRFQYRSTPCPSVKHGDEWGEPSRCDGGDGCQYCHSRTEQQFHPEIYKSTKCNDMRQTGYCPRGPFCAFAHVEKSLGMVNEWGCHDLHLTSPSSTGSGQPGNAKRRDSPAEGGPRGSEQDSKQNHLAVFAAVHPPAPSVSSSVASSLASSAGSGSSSPTALPAPPARALPLGPASSTVEAVLGSALDLHLSNVNIASLEKDLEEQDGHDLGAAGPRSLAGSAPVAIPGSLPRAPSLHSPSSASTSPLGSLSQPLPGPVGSSAMTPPQQPPPLRSEPGTLGSAASSYSPLGLNGVPGSIWDFVSGSFSPSPSPILSAGPPSSSSASPNGAELARVRRQLDEAKRKIRQWEESWQQVKQVCDAWQREAQEAKERARVADSDRQLALQKKEEVEAQVKQLQEELEGLGVASTLPGLRGCGDIGTIPLPKLHSLQSQLRLDLEAVDGVIFQLRAKQCVACRERAHGAVLRPCQHHILCEPCAATAPECPYCKGQPLQW
ncbi:unk like zinc finger [Homo sapiens]|uniref:Unk like zinc finger n=2 Tax=Homo sapiens TaxID=9606 RepID=A0A0A0MRZ1_HUMAN|nr:putative E3 ubiquitin-protein ligase UNKL isoform 7 [Homo sapiens]KAI2576334.1 unk like zinc finger [Homo sapiens]KAI4052743.1 unk like zinc finger [Homo sapiens]|eukprot:XP_005255562.1 putative E3 ubiquitin-protein ligase UNKL isoform X2 [Homo sapiens]